MLGGWRRGGDEWEVAGSLMLVGRWVPLPLECWQAPPLPHPCTTHAPPLPHPIPLSSHPTPAPPLSPTPRSSCLCSLRTTLCLQHQGRKIGVACIYLAMKLLQIDGQGGAGAAAVAAAGGGMPWWALAGVTAPELEGERGVRGAGAGGGAGQGTCVRSV